MFKKYLLNCQEIIVMTTVKGFGVVNKAEVDVFEKDGET